MFLRVIDGAIKYPIDVRAEFPDTSFPQDLSAADLSDMGVFSVQPVASPDVLWTQIVFEGEPQLVNGAWVQSWVVRDATDAEKSAMVDARERQCSDAAQVHLDAGAQSRGYDDIVAACSYAASSHVRFGQEGRDCLQWRDAVWDAVSLVFQDVRAGRRDLPTADEVVAALPQIVWTIGE